MEVPETLKPLIRKIIQKNGTVKIIYNPVAKRKFEELLTEYYTNFLLDMDDCFIFLLNIKLPEVLLNADKEFLDWFFETLAGFYTSLMQERGE